MNDLDAIQIFFRLFSEIKIKSEYCFLTKHGSCDVSKMVIIWHLSDDGINFAGKQGKKYTPFISPELLVWDLSLALH